MTQAATAEALELYTKVNRYLSTEGAFLLRSTYENADEETRDVMREYASTIVQFFENQE